MSWCVVVPLKMIISDVSYSFASIAKDVTKNLTSNNNRERPKTSKTARYLGRVFLHIKFLLKNSLVISISQYVAFSVFSN